MAIFISIFIDLLDYLFVWNVKIYLIVWNAYRAPWAGLDRYCTNINYYYYYYYEGVKVNEKKAIF